VSLRTIEKSAQTEVMTQAPPVSLAPQVTQVSLTEVSQLSLATAHIPDSALERVLTGHRHIISVSLFVVVIPLSLRYLFYLSD